MVDAQRCGGITLRVKIDYDYRGAKIGQGSGNVHRGRRLPDPTLLISDCDDPR
jgi:hypothetical protein